MPPARHLPGWPFYGLFLGYPVWWLLGVSPFAVFGCGVCALVLMVSRRQIVLPRLWWWWIAFLAWGFASATMIDTGARMVGFGQRWLNLIGATVLVLYVYNAPVSLPRRRVLATMGVFGVWMTVGGYLGMAFPWARVTTPASALLPVNLAENSYVNELLNPRFAEVQDPWGASEAFVRPSAPFPYTNAWGHAFVLLLPVVAALAAGAPRRVRCLLAAGVAVSLPVALATLNRGIAVGIAVVATYLLVRNVRRITVPGALGALGLSAAVGGVVLASGVLDRLGERTTISSTTQDRASLYAEAFQRTLESPLVGWGAPRPSYTLQVSVGTQGHFWYLLFSHGFVGLGLFLTFVWGTALVTRPVRDLESQLLHAVVVCLGVMLLFYGVDGIHLVIALSCAMLLSRPERPAPSWALVAVPPNPGSSARSPVSIS